jgi:hypothetical protein
MFGRFVGWFKIRYVFTDEQLMDAIDMLERSDLRKLSYEGQVKAEKAWKYIAKELVRRGHSEYDTP